MNKEGLPEIALGIIRNKSSKILIIQRAKVEKGTGDVKLSWAFPGGKIEGNESKEKAVEREVFEETGYKSVAKSVISERTHPQFPVYVYYIECDLVSEKPINKPTDEEISQVKLIEISELDKFFTTNLDPKVAEYLGI